MSEPAPPVNTPPSADEAAGWLKRIAEKGDKAAFISLFDYFAPRIKSFLRRQGLEPAQAEDLAQDVMFQIWRRAAQFDPSKARASTWIYTIARNRLIDERRKNRPMGVQLPETDIVEGSDAPMHEMEMGAEGARIRAAMSDLPPEHRDLIEESYFNEYSHSAIAEKRNLPLGTVKSRLRLALKHLRKNLGGEDQ